MATLNIQAPDGKTLKIDVPEGTDPSKYDSIVDEVMKDYTGKQTAQEGPGALKSGALGVMSGIPGAETVVSGLESTFTPKTYEEAHQGLEQAKDQAWENHPVAYGAGKGAGIVGTTLLAPEAEGLQGAMALGTGIAALSGADAAEKPSDIPLSAIKSAPVGTLTGLGGGLLSKALSPAVAKGTLASLGTKTTTEDIQNYLNNPEAIRKALTAPEVGAKVADVTSDIGKASSQLSGEARGLLDPNKVVDIRDIKNAAMQTLQKYYVEGNPATSADQTSINAVVDQYQKIAQIAEANGGKVPETTLRDMIDRLQAATKDSTYGNPEAGASQTALKEMSGGLNDILRTGNESYAKQMAPSAELANLSSDVKSHFGIEPNAEKILSPTDKTATRISNAMNEAKPEGGELLERIKGATGQDLQKILADAKTKAAFEAPGAGGGLRALLPAIGYGLGRTTGIPFGGIAGAGAGHYAAGAMNGGNIAKGILDLYLKGANTGVGKLAMKYGPVLANAAKTGGTQLAATHFVLATSNPEYQALVDHVQNNNEGQ